MHARMDLHTGHPNQNSAGARRQLMHEVFGRRRRTRERWKAKTILQDCLGRILILGPHFSELILSLSSVSFSIHFFAFSDTEI